MGRYDSYNVLFDSCLSAIYSISTCAIAAKNKNVDNLDNLYLYTTNG